jgi:hypothetical protein
LPLAEIATAWPVVPAVFETFMLYILKLSPETSSVANVSQCRFKGRWKGKGSVPLASSEPAADAKVAKVISAPLLDGLVAGNAEPFIVMELFEIVSFSL